MTPEDSKLSLPAIRDLRHSLWANQEYLRANSQKTDNEKEFLVELHNLAVDIQSIFNSSFINKNNRYQQSLDGVTITFKTGPDGSLNSNDYVQLSRNNRQQIMSTPTKSQSKFVYNDSRMNTNLQSEHLQGQSFLVKSQEYQQALTNIKHLEKQKNSLISRLETSKKKLEQVSDEKKYCFDLLHKNSIKQSDLQIQRKVLRKENHKLKSLVSSLEGQVQKLVQKNMEKNILLKDIDEFLSNGDVDSSKSKKYGNLRNTARDENNKLVTQILRYQSQISKFNNQLQYSIQQVKNLTSANQELSLRIMDLQQQNRVIRLKNQQVINIQESKKLNEIVHKENRHLLQVNYQLGNKISENERQIEKLILRIIELEGNEQYLHHDAGQYVKSQEYGISTNPSASKGVCIQSHKQILPHKPSNSSLIVNSSAQNTINKLNTKLKNQTDLNSELQNKIQDLLDQLYVCQKSIFEKQKQIANLNITLNRSQTQHQIPTTEVINSQERGESYDDQKIIEQEQNDKNQDILSLQQFVEKFQPSLMDTLFIMLRITEIAVIMLQESCIKTIIPQDLLLQLDDPKKPQNIVVELRSGQSQQNTSRLSLFESPESVKGYEITEASIVWNIGMVFYYLICKQAYFKNVQDLIQSTESIEFRQNQIPEVQAIIENSLRKNPEDRISLDELLECISQQINKIFQQD